MGYIVEAEELLCGHRKAGWMGTSPGNTDYSDLRELLTSNAEDAALCEAYDRLLVSWSCEGAAKGYLAALGFICVSRPHLADRLLCRPIDALLQLGAENAEAVASFAGYLVREATDYFVQWTGDDGVQWLRAEFPKFAESMSPLFEDCLRDLEARLRTIDEP